MASALLGACGDDDDSGGSADVCTRFNTVVSDLKCPASSSSCADLQAEGLAAAKAAHCESQYNAYNDCAVAQPSSSFECDSGTGGVSPKAGVCQSENDALKACFTT